MTQPKRVLSAQEIYDNLIASCRNHVRSKVTYRYEGSTGVLYRMFCGRIEAKFVVNESINKASKEN